MTNQPMTIADGHPFGEIPEIRFGESLGVRLEGNACCRGLTLEDAKMIIDGRNRPQAKSSDGPGARGLALFETQESVIGRGGNFSAVLDSHFVPIFGTAAASLPYLPPAATFSAKSRPTRDRRHYGSTSQPQPFSKRLSLIHI